LIFKLKLSKKASINFQPKNVNNSENLIELLVVLFVSGKILWVLPKEIGKKLIDLHPDPKAFWFGQFFSFILRNNLWFDTIIRNATEKLQLPKTYVG
jgi:hypothetical protein